MKSRFIFCQRYNYESYEEGELFMKQTAKRLLCVIAFAIIMFVVIWGSMRMVQWNEEQEKEQKKLEEEHEAQVQKNAEKIASAYMDSYTENLQEDMCEAGLSDLKVTYDACNRDFFDEYWNIDDYGEDDYCAYYVLDYYSDSIDSIYEQETKDGDFQSFIKLLNDECCMKDNRDEGGAYYQHKVRAGGQTVLVFIGDVSRVNNITIKKDNGHQYTLNRDDDDVRVFVDEELVYRKSDEQNSNTTPSSGGYLPNSGSGWTSGGNSNSGSKGNSSSKWNSDPYDVDDYDDPDDFAGEWEDEFDDGYDEAYDYWEDEHD